jgi:DNA-binding NarL/FixJ family response regulator
MIKVFNADDHPILRKGITNLVVESPDMEWVGSAENGTEALKKILILEPDVAILDIEMPGMTGIEVAKTLFEKNISTAVVILTLFKDETFFRRALKSGIKGYLLKESSEKEIIDCIRSVSQGRAYVNASMSHLLFAEKEEKSALSKLSQHERNILKLIAKSKSTAEIAEMLFLSPKTISNHRNNISKKLELKGEQNGLLKWALAHKEQLD